ncbi:unnamed protein product [Pedinophyceae sp. YPF-701]|nr:unnamed protein product [Pedinophyceae sp. YPF-701]
MSIYGMKFGDVGNEIVSKSLRTALDFEKDFNGWKFIQFSQEHTEIPIFAVTAYLFFVFYFPGQMVHRSAWKGTSSMLTVALWNLGLAAFSLCGALRMAPFLLTKVHEEGFRWTVCTDPGDWYINGPVGFWMMAFIFSKIPELMDTVWLVLKKKPVIFLHWFHHLTVLLYCWHSYVNRIGPGIWFGAMNYCVHAIMYFYYFLATVPSLRKLARPMAQLITTVQILQMVVGSTVTVASAWYVYVGGAASCHVNSANWKMGLAMYLSYLVLFCVLFIDKYLPKDKTGRDKAEICGVEVNAKQVDRAGFFHTDENKGSNADLRSAKKRK